MNKDISCKNLDFKRKWVGWMSGAALVFGLGFSNMAAAVVTAKAAVGPTLSDSTLELNQEFTIGILLDNTAVDSVDGILQGKFLAGTEISVKLAVKADGVTDINNTFEMVPVLPSGCESNPGGYLQSCVFDGANLVTIKLATDVNMVAGQLNLNIGSFRVKAKTPVNPPENGLFLTTASTPFGSFFACYPNIGEDFSDCTFPGSGTGSSGGYFPGSCDVRVDKQLSCDGGKTWVDEKLVNENDDLTNGCQALTTDQIMVRYQVSNVGTLDAGQCVLTDINSVGGQPFGNPSDPGTIAAGKTYDIPGAGTALCGEWSVNEPNTATVTCNTCNGVTKTEDPKLTAFDSASFSCLKVDLLVDRAVSCVDGVPPGFNDDGLVAANEDGTHGPTAINGNLCEWKYQVQNAGTATLYACQLIDSNALVTPSPINVGTLVPGAPIPYPATNKIECSDQLEASETPGGMVSLNCCTKSVGSLVDCSDENRVQVYDKSTVTCMTPDFNVSKACDVNTDTKEASFKVTVTNTGDLDLIDCQATDTIYGGACPHTGEGTTQLLSPNVAFGLSATDPEGKVQVLTGSKILEGDICNFVSVTCNDSLTGEPLEPRTSEAFCDVPSQGCLTRTPGFWGTHPKVTQKYLNVEVCGTTINNVDAGSATSAIEAMCSVGKDSKIQGPQMTQLIRQCTAAALNIASTQELGGECSSDYPGIDKTFAACCGGESSVCTGDKVDNYDIGSCIDRLDAFNNWGPDTLNFDFKTGPADSSVCQAAKGNNVVVKPTL